MTDNPNKPAEKSSQERAQEARDTWKDLTKNWHEYRTDLKEAGATPHTDAVKHYGTLTLVDGNESIHPKLDSEHSRAPRSAEVEFDGTRYKSSTELRNHIRSTTRADVFLTNSDADPNNFEGSKSRTSNPFIPDISMRPFEHIPSFFINDNAKRGQDEIIKLLSDNNDKHVLSQQQRSDLFGNLSDSVRDPTKCAPMLQREGVDRADQTMSIPYEKQLVEKLKDMPAPITRVQMTKAALDICQNDTDLALLTLANCTKNMACVERRQTTELPMRESLKKTYTAENVDEIMRKIEPLGATPDAKYNKEGALYHYFGAMYFGHSFYGPAEGGGVDIARNAVNAEQILFGHEQSESDAGHDGAYIGDQSRRHGPPMPEHFSYPEA